jgi:GNAT superfamily N-acetyltransferase
MPLFSLETYDPNHLEGMTALYNAETAFEPHIVPLTPELFVELVERKSYFDPTGLLVAREGSEVIGWVHACLAPGSEPWHDGTQQVARIRMLLFPRAQLDVGRALMTAATTWLRERDQGPIEAMHAESGYPFYRGLWLGGEPMGAGGLPQVQLAFEVGGYKLTQESIFMTAELSAAPSLITPEVKVAIVESPAEMKHDGVRESWIGFAPMRTRALLEGEEVGHLGWVVLPHVAARLGAPCLNIYWLAVSESYRRQGIAAALVSRALARGYAQGARFASVGTQLWNSPAHATYAKFGFHPHGLLLGRKREEQ